LIDIYLNLFEIYVNLIVTLRTALKNSLGLLYDQDIFKVKMLYFDDLPFLQKMKKQIEKR